MRVSGNKHEGPEVRANQPGGCKGQSGGPCDTELGGKRTYREARREGGTVGWVRCHRGSGAGKE